MWEIKKPTRQNTTNLPGSRQSPSADVLSGSVRGRASTMPKSSADAAGNEMTPSIAIDRLAKPPYYEDMEVRHM